MKAFSSLSSGGGTSASLFLYVEDVDAVFTKAVSAGATVSMPLNDAFWGDRAGGIIDPFQYFTNWIRKSSIPITISNI